MKGLIVDFQGGDTFLGLLPAITHKNIEINNNSFYKEISLDIRKKILELIFRTKSPHIGPSFSIVEILVALYFRQLKIFQNDPFSPDRDRFILSKGHACVALYAVLAKRGFISESDLDGFAVDGGVLEQHPNMDLRKGIEVSTGSLGHGLSLGTGMALAFKSDNKPCKTYVLLGDGECNEGSIWESAMFAAQHKLNNLFALIDYNRMQALGNTEDIINLDPLALKWESFGWHVQEINGHSFKEIFQAFESKSCDKPNVLILHTTKGKGVSFMENKLLWHYRSPDIHEYELALGELSR